MTRYFVSIRTISLGLSITILVGCEHVVLSPHLAGDAKPGRQAASDVPSQNSTAASSENVNQTINTDGPTERVVLELTVRELGLELELKQTTDPTRRAKLKREIESLRDLRHVQYQTRAKGALK